MNKLLKTILIALLLFTFCFNFAYATESEDEEENTVIEETPSSGLSTLSTNDVASVSSVYSYSQANLELNNILSIILIAVGVVIILLAFAILIKSGK